MSPIDGLIGLNQKENPEFSGSCPHLMNFRSAHIIFIYPSIKACGSGTYENEMESAVRLDCRFVALFIY